MTKAFSLVELSIVLVILGLLTGGILAGQSLIRGAEIRSISTEQNKWITAAQTFRDKYFALPGDMKNATAFWTQTATCPGTSASPSSGSPTCNGDGNGLVDVSANANETFRFWQHLANAGIAEGTYTGVPASATDYSVNSANSPRGKLGQSYWFVRWWGTRGAATSYPPAQYDNALFFGAPGGDEGGDKILSPGEAWNLDVKMDDGMALTGKVMARYYRDCTTATTSGATSDKTNTYVLSKSTVECAPVFLQAF